MTTQYLDPPDAPESVAGPLGEPGSVLVLAPHPDDETAGPGGTIRLHANRGDRVKVVFLTNGLAAAKEGTQDPDGYRKKREEEARVACQILGVESVDFWGYPDGARARVEDLGVLVPRILSTIEDWKPVTIYVPRQEEIHRDHHVAAVAARMALDQIASDFGKLALDASSPQGETSSTLPRLFGYEIWTAALPTHVVDVSDVHEVKVKACEAYLSQLEHTEIIWAFTGLTMYRSIFLPKGARYGEAFIEYRPRANSSSDS